uniref:Uncharacterized protein n=1 Tax=Chromera velia CCMP2878 TaxID=1169474 RepID=A0A0K6S896_9ALVE|eukprot:Cvel_5418.t3-p1 / transcript=Cvel_5418.t3 / gene=Cvel_5418 / organism=Chromera_velia_CCMP2878 / gene_product=hypothetical protein / transcript_product=hypothetical protein / location=Cvel_scaffold252:44883-46554(+) / protein_length=395 / sequence_SO=supercontig / SO=protein_coding / is_pseudo=false
MFPGRTLLLAVCLVSLGALGEGPVSGTEGQGASLTPSALQRCYRTQAEALGIEFKLTEEDFVAFTDRVNSLGPAAVLIARACEHMDASRLRRLMGKAAVGAQSHGPAKRKLQQREFAGAVPEYPTVAEVASFYNISSATDAQETRDFIPKTFGLSDFGLEGFDVTKPSIPQVVQSIFSNESRNDLPSEANFEGLEQYSGADLSGLLNDTEGSSGPTDDIINFQIVVEYPEINIPRTRFIAAFEPVEQRDPEQFTISVLLPELSYQLPDYVITSRDLFGNSISAADSKSTGDIRLTDLFQTLAEKVEEASAAAGGEVRNATNETLSNASPSLRRVVDVLKNTTVELSIASGESLECAADFSLTSSGCSKVGLRVCVCVWTYWFRAQKDKSTPLMRR